MALLAGILEAFGLIPAAVPASTRLPTDATLNQGVAATIAANPARRSAAYAYWADRFANEVGEDPFGAGGTDALKLGAALADAPSASLAPGREHLTLATDDELMIQGAGCMISLAEIAKHIHSAGTPATMLADVKAFAAAATGPADAAVDVAQVARGIRACRELYDAGRRLMWCRANAARFTLDLAEVLALFRQEGALGVTPPQASLPHGPLIETVKCRTPRVELFDNTPQRPNTAERPGFSLVYPFRLHLDANENDVSKRFDAYFRNMLVVGGLDSVMLPRLPADDELRFLLARGEVATPRLAPLEHIQTAFRAHLKNFRTVGANVTQHQLLEQSVLGLMMADLDAMTAAGPAESLFDRCDTRLTNLMDAHRIEQRTRGGQKEIHLLGGALGYETWEPLTTQAQWYASRARLETLVARRDRTQPMRAAPRMSPFLTYMRFHTGDAIFMGIVLRTIANLENLRADWVADPGWGTALPDALAAASLDPATATQLRADAAGHWRQKVTTIGDTHTAWRHVGLVSEIRSAPGPPSWLPDAPPLAEPMKTTAEIAKRCVEAIVDEDLLDSLHAALSLTPVDTLLDHRIITAKNDPRQIPLNAHSFERLRIAYEDAITAAGI